MNRSHAHDIVWRTLAEVAPDVDQSGLDVGSTLGDAIGPDPWRLRELIHVLRDTTGIELTTTDVPPITTLDELIDLVVVRWDWRARV